MRNNLIILFSFLFSFNAISQSLNDELGFIYVKAEYLLSTERYNDAIDQYSSIISKDPGFKDALLKRALAKTELSSWRGVKSDVMQYIGIKGITKDAIRFLGLANSELGDYDAAAGSLALYQSIENDDVDVTTALAKSYHEIGDSYNACTMAKKASKMGSSKAAGWVRKYCDGVNEKKDKPTVPKDDTKPTKDDVVEDEDVTKVEDNSDEILIEESEDEVKDEPIVDHSENIIEVDEDLRLIIKNGLGSRRILDTPNILILSDQSGSVAVDICVSKAGRVESAEINADESDIHTPSLQTLAIRKAKEFWFARMGSKSMCGTMVFEITGRT